MSCPGLDAWLRRLEESPSSLQDEFLKHLESCDACAEAYRNASHGEVPAQPEIEQAPRPAAESTLIPPRPLPEALPSFVPPGPSWEFTPGPNGDPPEPVAEAPEGVDATTTPDVEPAPGAQETLVPPSRKPAAVATERAEAYDLLAELGRGGMGVVYKARQRLLNRMVALKMIRDGSHAGPEQLARFRMEAEAVAGLRHQNIVQIYDIGEINGFPFVALELLEGGSLADRLAEGPRPSRPAASLTITLARAIEAAHQAGIIHRDLKPSNILFTQDGVAKIADFGLAKRLEAPGGQTETGQVMGTPSYMAPEQALGRIREVGPATDVYALGAILYEMLTGRPPFRAPSSMETVRQVIDDEPVPPSRLQPKISRDLETICLKCLSKRADRRYATAKDLADDLDRFLSRKPIRARRVPFWERGAKWARRHPATTVLSVVGLALVAASVASALWYDASVREEARREDQKIEGVRLSAIDDLRASVENVQRKKYDKAHATLLALRDKLEGERRLTDLLRRTQDELDVVEAKISEASDQALVLNRYGRFIQLLDEAIFQDIYGSELGHGRAGEKARALAREAIALFPDEGSSVLPAQLSREQRAEVETGRYLALMVWSQAIVRPLPGEDPKHQATEALRLLDRAAALRKSTPALHLCRAACLDRLGDNAGAAREREEAGRLEPTEAFDHLLLGQDFSRRQEWDAARHHFDAALHKQHDFFWASCLLAIADLNCTPPRAAEAKYALDNCLRQRKGYPWLYLLRGFAFSQLGAAERSLRRTAAADANPADESEVRFAAAEADFAEALDLDLDGPLRYALYVNRGTARFQRKRFADAVADFERAIALDPKRSVAHASLAQAFRRLGRRDDAIDQLGRAIAREPNLAALYRERALVRLSGADLAPAEAELALRDLEESACLVPKGDSSAAGDHALRGRTLLRLGRATDALAAADAALKLASGSTEAHLVRLGALLDLKRHDEVIASCDAALAKGPPRADVLRIRGLARVARGDFAGAVDDHTRALALRPNWSEAHALRGWSYLFANAPELALRDFEAVVRLVSSDPEGYSGRASANVRLGRVREAVADAEESLRHGTPSSKILYGAARTYAQVATLENAQAARRGRVTSRNALAQEARSSELLGQALDLMPADKRSRFLSDIVMRDSAFRSLLANPKFLPRATSIAMPATGEPPR